MHMCSHKRTHTRTRMYVSVYPYIIFINIYIHFSREHRGGCLQVISAECPVNVFSNNHCTNLTTRGLQACRTFFSSLGCFRPRDWMCMMNACTFCGWEGHRRQIFCTFSKYCCTYMCLQLIMFKHLITHTDCPKCLFILYPATSPLRPAQRY